MITVSTAIMHPFRHLWVILNSAGCVLSTGFAFHLFHHLPLKKVCPNNCSIHLTFYVCSRFFKAGETPCNNQSHSALQSSRNLDIVQSLADSDHDSRKRCSSLAYCNANSKWDKNCLRAIRNRGNKIPSASLSWVLIIGTT